MQATLPVEILVASLGIIGNIFVAHKRPIGLWLWLVSNLVALPLMLYSSMYGLAALYAVYAVTTLYSLVLWRRPATAMEGLSSGTGAAKS